MEKIKCGPGFREQLKEEYLNTLYDTEAFSRWFKSKYSSIGMTEGKIVKELPEEKYKWKLSEVEVKLDKMEWNSDTIWFGYPEYVKNTDTTEGTYEFLNELINKLSE